ncbi:MFS transporter [Lactonifactor longoviformis]|uniref:MFS transporter n=1 Tax=Lactonifactor longoviformis TaxID=341220 RepID=UPI001D002D8F|nr:MFS transporter [Lactonifactor longoviformis]MCB5712441.1 MFS transporter [Lactonifactor longoviformis]MCB5716485.1 MFS transporter [Lactonifactor longoviformis]
MEKKLSVKVLFTLVVLGACWSIVYIVPFIQYIWYNPFQDFLGATNVQMGLLLTIYGFGNIFGAPIGGWVADRFNYKYVYVASVFLNGVLSLIFVISPNYVMAVICWIGFAVSSLFMNYPTHIKIVRELATDENQGKVFGINESMIGLFNIIFNAIMMAIYVKFLEGVAGMKAAIIGIGILSFVLTAIVAFVLDNPKKKKVPQAEVSPAEAPKGNLGKDFLVIIKNPATWLVGISIFAVYSFLTTMSYFTPYFTDVLGVTVVFTGWVAILRQHGMTLIGAPVGGWLTDKIKSPSKVLIGVYIVGILGFVYLLNAKTGVNAVVLITLTIVLSGIVYVGRGAYYATITEAGVAREYTASTIGIAAALGFSPDLFQFTLFGHWLDNYGKTAYTYMFVFQTIVLVIGIGAAFMIIRMSKKCKKAEDVKLDIEST